MRTGVLARQTGVGVETLRHYEREGLLPEPAHRRSAYRDYPPKAVARLRSITRAQQLSFSLQEIKGEPRQLCAIGRGGLVAI